MRLGSPTAETVGVVQPQEASSDFACQRVRDRGQPVGAVECVHGPVRAWR
jgi:hypothetical protein